MYKVIWLVKFRQDKDPQEVLRWWRGEHAALAASTPGMIRYVQSYWVEPLDRETSLADPGRKPVFDGHAEHWFESREAYERAMTSEEWKRTVEDGPTHFESATRVGGVLSEHVVLWGALPDGR